MSDLERRITAGLRSLLGGRLAGIPRAHETPSLVGVIRDRLGLDDVETVDPGLVCESLGWRVREDFLGAQEGGQRAALLPRYGGGFTVLVDPGLTPSEREAGAAAGAVRRLRIAHELGHTLFYSEGAPPRRSIEISREEEEFCDAFAVAFVGPSSQSVG